MNYPGKELELFDRASFWRKYLYMNVKKFIGKKVLEVGAGIGSFTSIYKSNNKEITLADIPGLIEGAHEGIGLGDKFLRHIERCKTLIHLIDISEKDILGNYLKIRNELSKYDKNILKKKEIIIFNKLDLVNMSSINEKLKEFKNKVKKSYEITSLVSNQNFETNKNT